MIVVTFWQLSDTLYEGLGLLLCRPFLIGCQMPEQGRLSRNRRARAARHHRQRL